MALLWAHWGEDFLGDPTHTSVSDFQNHLDCDMPNDPVLGKNFGVSQDDPFGAGQYCMHKSADNGDWNGEFRLPAALTNGNVVIVECHYRLGEWQTTSHPGTEDLITFKDQSTINEPSGLQWDVNGRLLMRLKNGDIHASRAGLFTWRGHWHHIGIKLVYGVAGSVQVRLNGQTVISVDGVDTTLTNPIDRVTFAGRWRQETFFDNVLIMDDTGGELNDFLGPVEIACLQPNSDHTVAWSTTGANNFDALIPDDDNAVNTASVDGTTDMFDLPDLRSEITDVHAVVLATWGRRDDATSRQVVPRIDVGGTVAEATGFAIPNQAARIGKHTAFVTPPGAGSWTVADVNNLLCGYKLVNA
ncbi:MAG: hypothetical protein ACPGO3_09915 [Magnetospiraceae bacterium]